MRTILAAFATAALATVIVVLWGISRDEKAGDPRPDAPPEVEAEEVGSRRRDAGTTLADMARDYPGWVEGRGLAAPPSKGRADGLPDVISDLEVLTLGRTKVTANTMELKEKLSDLIYLLDRMTEEEKKALADYYATSDNLALKYHLTIVFRNRSGDPFVEPVADFYDHEPELVGEALGYMLGRAESAAEAFERLYAREIDPVRREKLLARASFIGSKRAEEMLIRAFDDGTPTDRRVAAAGLARMHTDEARQRLRDLLEGPFEAAAYDVSSSGPEREPFKDLRGVVVASVLASGVPEDRDRLIERLVKGDEDDAVASYVDDMMVAVPTSDYVPRVVEMALEKGEISRGLLNYVCARAEAGQLAELRRLKEMDLPDYMVRAVDNAISGLR